MFSKKSDNDSKRSQNDTTMGSSALKKVQSTNKKNNKIALNKSPSKINDMSIDRIEDRTKTKRGKSNAP